MKTWRARLTWAAAGAVAGILGVWAATGTWRYERTSMVGAVFETRRNIWTGEQQERMIGMDWRPVQQDLRR